MRSYLLNLLRDTFSKVCMIIIMAVLAVLGITQSNAVEVLSGLSGYWVVAIRVGLVVFALLIAWALVWHRLYQRRLRTWADRDRLELSAIACLSVGEKVGCPLNTDPQLSRHRLLKDAVASGELIVENMAGATTNVGIITLPTAGLVTAKAAHASIIRRRFSSKSLCAQPLEPPRKRNDFPGSQRSHRQAAIRPASDPNGGSCPVPGKQRN